MPRRPPPTTTQAFTLDAVEHDLYPNGNTKQKNNNSQHPRQQQQQSAEATSSCDYNALEESTSDSNYHSVQNECAFFYQQQGERTMDPAAAVKAKSS
jgi:hypothetical protein